MPIVAGYEFDYTDAGMDKAEKLRELEIEVRNADGAFAALRARIKAGTLRLPVIEQKMITDEENRIKVKKSRLKKQMSAITRGMKRKPDVEFE